jgi:hypothetical protein
MLRADVVQAVANGDFSVFQVETVDQALSLLAGAPAGEPDAQGGYPEGSPNEKVAARLLELSLMRQAYASMEVKVKKVRAGRSPQPEAPPKKPQNEGGLAPAERGRSKHRRRGPAGRT